MILERSSSPSLKTVIRFAMKFIDPDHFAAQGCLRLEGFHPRTRLAALKRALDLELKRVHAGRGVSASLRALPVFQQIGRLSALVKLPGLHETLATPELRQRVAHLGGRMPSGVQDTQLLLSPVKQGTWTLQGLNWHVDVGADADGPIPGIQAFFLIDDVAPHGGATLALAGSHRLGADAMPALRRVLRTSTDLERDLAGLGIRLVEMSGRAGDVFLMDLRTLHTPSVNTTAQVRMMATTRYFMGE